MKVLRGVLEHSLVALFCREVAVILSEAILFEKEVSGALIVAVKVVEDGDKGRAADEGGPRLAHASASRYQVLCLKPWEYMREYDFGWELRDRMVMISFHVPWTTFSGPSKDLQENR
ncbi:hypothetical protein Pyn_37368 [Prunus yedoensis var. nudiflora]|uniref:Uncharacterized protein n=1 Tax=Prunus yedoensis var. nudiflora TaxID=2094558 RepID=A0A314ZGL8_PRUYE|nr:hypothetical protein Pyn_37368 [Prunus yedoensis var. nudiflora]